MNRFDNSQIDTESPVELLKIYALRPLNQNLGGYSPDIHITQNNIKWSFL